MFALFPQKQGNSNLKKPRNTVYKSVRFKKQAKHLDHSTLNQKNLHEMIIKSRNILQPDTKNRLA